MTDLCKIKWENALRQAKEFNSLFDLGYIAIWGNDIIRQPFEISENKICLPLNRHHKITFCDKENCENDIYDTMEEINFVLGELKFYQEVKL